jgi:hypothetical protein
MRTIEAGHPSGWPGFSFALGMARWGMSFRTVTADPRELVKLAAAFDAAWIGVISAQTIGVRSQKAARQRLARIIIDLWRETPQEPLAARAVEIYLYGEPAMLTSLS